MYNEGRHVCMYMAAGQYLLHRNLYTILSLRRRLRHGLLSLRRSLAPAACAGVALSLRRSLALASVSFGPRGTVGASLKSMRIEQVLGAGLALCSW